MNIKQFIAHYIRVVLDGDLDKILTIAEQSQRDEEKDKAEGRVEFVPMYTMSLNDPSFYNSVNPKRARCAVPIAMTLFSVIDMIGTLLKPSLNEDTRESIQRFFDYSFSKSIAKTELPPQEAGVLNSVFRNGCMHSFFPLGMNISMDFDDTENKPLKVDEPLRKLTLNVNYLKRIVGPTLNLLMRDEDKHAGMQIILDEWMNKNYNTGKVKDKLDEFWGAISS